MRRTHTCTIRPAHLKILERQGHPRPARLRRTHTTTHTRPGRCPPCREIETQRYGLMERPCPMHSAPRVCLCCPRIRSFEIWPRALCPAHTPLSTTPCPAAYHPMPRCLPPHAPLSTTPCPAAYCPMPRWLPPHTPILGARRGVLVAVAAVKTRRRLARTLGRVRGAGTGMEPSLGHGRGGSLQWLPARVMSGLPRWHTQRYGRCQNSRYLFGQRRGVPHSRTTCSASRSPSSIPRHRPRSPATKRSDLNRCTRYSRPKHSQALFTEQSREEVHGWQ